MMSLAMTVRTMETVKRNPKPETAALMRRMTADLEQMDRMLVEINRHLSRLDLDSPVDLAIAKATLERMNRVAKS